MAHGFLNGSNYDNYNLGYNDGKKAEYDAFWDAVYATYNPEGKCNFAGSAWNDTTFNPKETLQPLIADSMFRECRITNLRGIFERNGVTFDFSKCTQASEFGYSSLITHYPELDFSSMKADRLGSIFSYSKCVSVPLILSDSGLQNISTAFAYCYDLVDLTIVRGVIGVGGLNLQRSTKLSRESIESIINALSDTTSGLSITLSLVAVNRAFAYVENGDDGSINQPWLDLVASKPNWAINLV